MTNSTQPLNIGRYEIRSELGRGGMAVVYRAFDPKVKREVAVKVLPERFLADGDFRARFEREAEWVAGLEHPAIVPLYDFGEDASARQLYYVMRLMPGGSLADRIRQGPLTLAQAAGILGQIGPALDQAHARGLVHRDLKPGNILFDQHGNAYIADFGIAKQIGSGATSTGGIIGTPAYMSPEQARGERELTPASDIYALGVILFEMLTGSVPFSADTPVAVALKQITEPPPQLSGIRHGLPNGAQLLIDQVLAKDPQGRYPSATALASAVNGLARGESVSRLSAPGAAQRPTLGPTPTFKSSATPTRPAPPPTSAARPWAWLLVGGSLLAGLAALAVLGVLIATNGGRSLFPAPGTPTANATAVALAAQIASTHAAETESANVTLPPATAVVAGPASATSAAQVDATRLAAIGATATIIAQVQTTIDAANAATAGSQSTQAATATAAVTSTAAVVNQVTAARIAFLKDNDIWLVTVDGSQLTQLTTDGGAKRNLRWLPGGETIAFITGKCLQAVNTLTKAVTGLGCFNSSQLVEGFEVSPDGRYFAASVDRITYVGDWQPDQMSPLTNYTGLRKLANCLIFNTSATQYLRWSADSARLAIMVIGVSDSGLAADTVQLLRFKCDPNTPPSNLDQFPGTRFTLPNFSQTRKFQDFGWDGRDLFALVDRVRNDGFGNLYVYNTATKRIPVQLDPLQGCCYRDPTWSLDGANFAFVFQDRNLGSVSKIQLFYASYNTLVSGGKLTPIPLPDGFFTSPTEKPEPVISP